MWQWLTDLCVSRPRKRRNQDKAVFEVLEPRQMLTVELLPGDMILTRNYRPPESDQAFTGFLVYRPQTQEFITLDVPRLDDPAALNDQLYISDFHLVWLQSEQGTPEPHVYFAGRVVKFPNTGDQFNGVFDFDITAGTLSSVSTSFTLNGRSSVNFADMFVRPDGTGLVTTQLSSGSLLDDIERSLYVKQTPNGDVYFEQHIQVLDSFFFQNFGVSTSDLEVDAQGHLYAAFGLDDGFLLGEEFHMVGGERHPPGIYRLDPEQPLTRDLIFSVPYGDFRFEFLEDGNILAMVRESIPGYRWYKKDLAAEQIVLIDPLTGESQLLWKPKKIYELDDLHMTGDGRLLITVDDTRKDGATAILELTLGGRKKPKPRVLYAESDKVDAPYGVITSGEFVLVEGPSTSAAAAEQATDETHKSSRTERRAQRQTERAERKELRRAASGKRHR